MNIYKIYAKQLGKREEFLGCGTRKQVESLIDDYKYNYGDIANFRIVKCRDSDYYSEKRIIFRRKYY